MELCGGPDEHMPYFSMNVRSRREVNTRDAANARQFEHWQTSAPALQNDRPDVHGPKVLNDMNPTNSRTLDAKPYKQNPTMKAGQDSFTQNPYFEGYAPSFDPRNAIREVRSAVTEDRFDRGVRESQRLLGRSFTNAWVKPDPEITKAYESLKPRMDDVTTNYKSTIKEMSFPH